MSDFYDIGNNIIQMASAAGGLTAGLALEVSASSGALVPAVSSLLWPQPSSTSNLNVHVDVGGVLSPGDPVYRRRSPQL